MTGYKEIKQELRHSKEETTKIKQQLANTGEDLKNTKEQLANTGEDLKNTNEQLANTGEDLKNTNEQLANTGEDLKTTKEQLANTDEDLKNTKDKLANIDEDLKQAKKECVHGKDVICGQLQQNSVENLIKQEYLRIEYERLMDDKRIKENIVKQQLKEKYNVELIEARKPHPRGFNCKLIFNFYLYINYIHFES